ncbi:molybdopterin-guanine dinucleotide biosynthesis protein B [Paenibacillaceae bacterium WGS1546]|uniref:molybdopterin-guanine dinucleotide biosynthesis protein B n=1 Tax=Cohnella sp. WGS1546 TaxID=3366810 RepID=UPI00372D3BB9
MQVVGYKNAGKTTLACELVRALAAEGRKVGTLKRDAHDCEPEPEGADTRRHREAGAAASALASSSRTSWVLERPTPLEELVSGMEARGIEHLIIEGFKTAAYPKIALLRDEGDADLLRLANVVATATRLPLPEIEREAEQRGIPVFVQPNPESFGPLLAYIRSLDDRN